MKTLKKSLALLLCLLIPALAAGMALAATFTSEQIQKIRNDAEAGNADAQFNLGLMYRKGDGVPQDNALAAQWYQKAADQGNSEAQLNLGVMYRKGLGVPQDEQKACELYTKSAEAGNISAQFNLGLLYYKGQGMPRDMQTSKKWFGKACSQGHQKACEAHRILTEQGY